MGGRCLPVEAVEGPDLVQQVVGTDLQRLDLCQQLHVLHLIVRDDLKAVLIVIPADTAEGLLVHTYH